MGGKGWAAPWGVGLVSAVLGGMIMCPFVLLVGGVVVVVIVGIGCGVVVWFRLRGVISDFLWVVFL